MTSAVDKRERGSTEANTLPCTELDTKVRNPSSYRTGRSGARFNLCGNQSNFIDASGMRDVDKLAHSKYGKYHAGCYPASRRRSYW